MIPAAGYLVDTNVLLRLFRKTDPLHQSIKQVLSDLNRRGSAYILHCKTSRNSGMSVPDPPNGMALDFQPQRPGRASKRSNSR